MSRYLAPIVLLGAAAYVWHFNGTHDDRYLLLPFLDLVPALAGDIPAQAEWSWKGVGALGVFLLLWTLVSDAMRRRRRRSIPIVQVDDQDVD